MSAPHEKPSYITAPNIYLVAMLVAGLVLGGVSLANPGLLEGYTSVFAIMLVISLIMDVALMRFVPGEVVPLNLEARFAGFFSGMATYLLMTVLLAG